MLTKKQAISMYITNIADAHDLRYDVVACILDISRNDFFKAQEVIQRVMNVEDYLN